MKKFIVLLVLGITILAADIKKEYYDTGKLKFEISYQNEVREGVSKSYWENGKLQFSIPYIKGKRDGEAKGYNENGTLLFKVIYKDNSAVSGYMYSSSGVKSKIPNSLLYTGFNKELIKLKKRLN